MFHIVNVQNVKKTFMISKFETVISFRFAYFELKKPRGEWMNEYTL